MNTWGMSIGDEGNFLSAGNTSISMATRGRNRRWLSICTNACKQNSCTFSGLPRSGQNRLPALSLISRSLLVAPSMPLSVGQSVLLPSRPYGTVSATPPIKVLRGSSERPFRLSGRSIPNAWGLAVDVFSEGAALVQIAWESGPLRCAPMHTSRPCWAQCFFY